MYKLFLLAHAGGNVWEYKKMLDELSDEFDIFPITLPGDASRLMDDMYDTLAEFAEEAKDYIISQIGENEKVFLFGHSFGGYLLYEIAAMIEKNIAGVVASCCHPYRIYQKPDKGNGTYFEYFGYNDDTPKEIIELFEPVIAHKIHLIDEHSKSYKLPEPCRKLDIPCTVVYGEDDDKNCGSEKWYEQYEESLCRIVPLRGHHFYWMEYDENIHELCRLIIELKERAL